MNICKKCRTIAKLDDESYCPTCHKQVLLDRLETKKLNRAFNMRTLTPLERSQEEATKTATRLGHRMTGFWLAFGTQWHAACGVCNYLAVVDINALFRVKGAAVFIECKGI